VDPAKFSWDFLPASDGNHYICIKNTNLCLTPDYNKETQRVDVFIQEKNTNPETYWIEKLQQWKYDGKKLINPSIGLNYCATMIWYLTLQRCDPTNLEQQFEII